MEEKSENNIIIYQYFVAGDCRRVRADGREKANRFG